jgi:Spy/CpxP family protein refolding chaperone
MKTSLKLVLTLIVLGLSAVSPCAQAADKPAKAGQRAKAAAEEHDKMLTEKLKLTAEQQEKLAAIRKTEAEQLKEVRGDRTKMADVLKNGREQVRAILTPDQQKEFDAIKPEVRPGRKGKKAGSES